MAYNTALDVGATSDFTAMAVKGKQLRDDSLNSVNMVNVTQLGSYTKPAAVGTNLATAVQLTAGFNWVTAADGTVGAKLPATPAAGTMVFIKNDDTANAVLKVYPDAAATINAIGSNGSISMAAKTSALFWAATTTQWFTIPLLPS